MRVLMFLRDALPPERTDVRALFGRALREQGIQTCYVGHATPGQRCEADLPGECIDLGPRHRLGGVVTALATLWSRRRLTDLVIVRDQPLLGACVLVLARCLRLPRVYWMSFPMPLGDRTVALIHRARGQRWRACAVEWRGRIAGWIERRVTLPLSQHVFVQSDEMRRVMAQSLPGLDSRMTAVPMGVDDRELQQLPACDARLPPGRWVGYLGSMDQVRRLDVLLQCIALLRERHPQTRLLLIGGAPRAADLDWLFAIADRLGIRDCVEHVSPLPMRDAWSLLRQVDVAVSPIPNGPLYDVSSPTKVVEYLALGLPVVATDIPDQRDFLAQCGGGLCVPFTAHDLAQGIADLFEAPQRALEQAAQAVPRALALRSYSVIGAAVGEQLRRFALRQAG
jgi:glycosyltransferase involved in cell wall biosynthesis